MERIDKRKVFEEYTENFSTLSLYTKQKEILEELKRIIAILSLVNTDFKQKGEMLLNKEQLEQGERYTSEDEYYNYLFSLVQYLKEELGKHLDGTVSKLYK